MRSKELVVGFVIILSAVVLVVGTFFLTGTSFGQDTREAEGLFREVGQLMEGNDVKYRGVPIGTVEGIDVEPGGTAVRVSMRIDEGLPLPEDAGVVASPESMFGDWQVEVVSMAQFPRYDFLRTRDPDVLPGHALPDISRLTAVADEIAGDIATLTARIEVAFTEETAQNLGAAIDNISATTEGLSDLVQQQARTFERVAMRVEEAAAAIELAAGEAGGVAVSVDSIVNSQEVAGLLENADALSAELRQTAIDLRGLTEGAGTSLARMDSTFARVDRITSRIESGEGSLGLLLTDTSLVVSARETLDEMHLLLEEFRTNPRRFINFSIF